MTASRSAPPRPGLGNSTEGSENQAGDTDDSETSEGAAGLSCISECNPEYPSELEGEEGSAVIKVVVDEDGKVVDSEVSKPNSDSRINEAAIEAARKMEFTAPGERVAARIKINFTVEGSDFNREASESQAQNEQEREQREQEQKEQLAREREQREQEQKEQLARVREQQQLQRQQQLERPLQQQQERQQ